MWGATAWFTWFLEDPQNKIIVLILLLLGCIISLLYARINKIKIVSNSYVKIGIILFIIANLLRYPSLLWVGITLTMYFPLIILISDKNNGEKCLNNICTLLSILLFVYR